MDLSLSGSVKKRFFADKLPLQGKVQGELDPCDVNASFIFVPVIDVPGVDRFYIIIFRSINSIVLVLYAAACPKKYRSISLGAWQQTEKNKKI